METLLPGLTFIFKVTVVLSDQVELELISACHPTDIEPEAEATMQPPLTSSDIEAENVIPTELVTVIPWV